MRVTNKQLLNVVTRSVTLSSEQLLKAQERVASMKVINRPSDDPAGMNRVLDYRKKIASIDQYLRNITPAKTRVETTVAQLEEVHDLLEDAKNIAISQVSVDDASARATAATQVNDIYDGIRNLANTRLSGSYLFSGYDTSTEPFSKNETTEEVTYNGDSGEIRTILGEGVTLRINAHGNETFTGSGVTDGVNIFDELKTLKDALEATPFDSSAVMGQVDQIEKALTQIEKMTAQQSTVYNRLEQTEDHWINLKQTFENALSDTEDADMAQVVVELQSQEIAYEMALASAARVLEKSLLEFLG